MIMKTVFKAVAIIGIICSASLVLAMEAQKGSKKGTKKQDNAIAAFVGRKYCFQGEKPQGNEQPAKNKRK